MSEERDSPAVVVDASQPAAPGDGARLRRMKWADRLSALVEVALCSGFPTQLAIGFALTAAGLAPLGPDGALSPSYLVALSLVDTVVLIGLIVAFLRAGGERVGDALLGHRPVGAEALLGLPLALGVGALVAVSLGLIAAVAPWLHNVAHNPLARLIEGPLGPAGFALVAVVAGAVREEIQRAFVLRRFRQHLGGGWVGVVVFSAAFGAGHTLQGWDVAIVTSLMGACWGMVYLARRSLVAPMVSHSLFNLAGVFRYTLFGA